MIFVCNKLMGFWWMVGLFSYLYIKLKDKYDIIFKRKWKIVGEIEKNFMGKDFR